MRMRNIPDAAEKVARYDCYVSDPTLRRGAWRDSLSVDGPLHVEIGSGKGRFITTLASMHPQTAFVAIERYTTVLTKLVRRIPEQGLRNLAVVNMDARALPDCFSPGEITRIYLNFSDPWPKSRHENRRLTYKGFLDRYRQVLAADGEVHFKTDNAELFDYSLRSLQEAGWEVSQVTRNLHAELPPEGNVMTEYEERFSSLGQPIHRLVARPPVQQAL